jgi:tetratricopeptide (TPR) repeat protein
MEMAGIARLPILLILAAGCACAGEWQRLRTPHFELLTTSSPRDAWGLAHHLEQLRELFVAQKLLPGDAAPQQVRILAFGSVAEYAPYRLSSNAAAYYAGGPARHYIVLPLTGAADFGVAAHEYVHLMAHQRGLRLPPWLSEGMADVFSTTRFRQGQAVVGGAHAARLRGLRAAWLPFAEITALEAVPSQSRERSSLFYAESWALVHMLLFSPAYQPRFGELLRASSAGTGAPLAFAAVYHKSLAEVQLDVRSWIKRRNLPSVTFSAPDRSTPADGLEPVAGDDALLSLAELQLAIGHRAQARAAYLSLEARHPEQGEVQAALGRIALSDGERTEARQRFHQAVLLGVRNARLCYDYALLAQDAGLPESEVVAALEQSLAIDPRLDDARYSLALAHMNAGRYPEALRHFQAMGSVGQARAFAYYAALAHTEAELGMHEEAGRSAMEARRYAHTDEERSYAGELAWVANSDLVVRMAPGGRGQMQRIPHRAPGQEDAWNPFIEPADRIERQEGDLQEVDCAGAATRLTLSVADHLVVLGMPDPSRVQVRKAGGTAFEFVCGAQSQPTRIRVEYAVASDPARGVAGVLRGIQVLP